ncbi:Hypothetical protein CINCED_3A025068 [Cinara cedri]|uniref:Uncharacterized protein n=1 Tax=Cinara cedri TaxID=506608 RepID=A0A5E4NAY4_9HEMI|nr:Hypothetical protein CINCED_3A025068 [Cinara cedri]
MSSSSPSSEIKSSEITDTQNSTTTSSGQTIYAPRWIRKTRLGHVTRDSSSSNKTPTVGPRTNKRSPSSWCSINVDNYSDDEIRPKLQQSSSLSSELTPFSTKSSVNSLQPMQNPSNSSKYKSSDDLLYNNALVNKLQNPSVIQKKHLSFNTKNSNIGSSNATFEWFLPGKETTYSDECKRSGEFDEYIETNLTFEHRFHWSENIEYCSPWVEDRSREIFNHVNEIGLFGAQREEIGHDDKNISDISKDDSIRDDCTSETDDGITYAVASRFCDILMKHNKTTDDKSKCQCSSDEQFKWTKLYEKLGNYE